jgi:hypothetical protein
MKLLGIINVGFDVIDQLLTRFLAFIRYGEKMEISGPQSAIHRLPESQ